MKPTRSSRFLLLVLLFLVSFLVRSTMGETLLVKAQDEDEDAADTPAVADDGGDETETDTETDPAAEGDAEGDGDDGDGEEGDDGDEESDETGEEGDAEDDDEGFQVEDLLPGFENTDADNFVKGYILGNPEYYQELYVAPKAVTKFNNLPRFGHSDDFSLLMGDYPDHYYLGLLFVGTLILTIFFFWGIAIGIFKCIGPKHVGFLAGFPFQVEGKKSAAGRVVFSVGAWMMIVSTIFLISLGLPRMQYLSDSIAFTADEIQIVEKEVKYIVTTLLVVSAKTKPIRDELVDFLKRDICPLEPGSDTEDQVRSVGEDTYDAMTDLEDFIEGYLLDVEDGVNTTNTFTSNILAVTDMAQFVGNPVVTAIVFPYFIIPIILLVAVGMGWYDFYSETFYSFVTWLVVPLLVLLTILAFVTATTLVVAIQANADICVSSGAPEDSILGVLNNLDLEDDSGSQSKDDNGPSDNFFYDIMVFYTHQCTKPNPWEFMEGHYADLARGRNILGEFIRSIEDTTLLELSQECGMEYGPIVVLLKSLQDLITILSQTSIRALTLMSCRNVVPLYTAWIYESTCTLAPVSLNLVFMCIVCIAFFGMVCITFRGAYYPIDFYYYDATGRGDKQELYPTDEVGDSGLADTPCNEKVLEEQEDQCIDATEAMEESIEIQIYHDDEEKEYETDDDEQDHEKNFLLDKYGEPMEGPDAAQHSVGTNGSYRGIDRNGDSHAVYSDDDDEMTFHSTFDDEYEYNSAAEEESETFSYVS
ncbi:unnamed protein product [Pseudo-nitzschia multistriata]|uniref:Chloride channel CLIC-like protein 1 n=1 Tax=Pseudo-nitzschia multistriata TaxID=183589 RepID=A0A448ZG31_9STRA|nr:unnamed protein product [Pseudo-nitzschia multistriata]